MDCAEVVSRLRPRPRRLLVPTVCIALLASAVPAAARQGELDASFGDAGVTSLQSFDHRAGAVALTPDGKIVAAGDGFRYENGDITGHELTVARFGSGGSLDQQFGQAGVASVAIEAFEVRGVDVDAQNRTVIVGQTEPRGSPQIELARLSPNGELDESFGDGGIAVLDAGAPAAPNAVRVVGNGDIVVAGGARQRGFLSVRLDSSGTPDATYGKDGYAFRGGADRGFAEAADIDSRGGMAILGYRGALVRVDPDGKLDPRFSRNRQAASFGKCDRCNQTFERVALGRDGTVIVGGVKGGNRNFARGQVRIVRYLQNGNRDHSFSGDGLITLSKAKHDHVESLEPLASGKLLVVRRTPVDGYGDYPNKVSVVRLTNKGRFDSAFGRDGATRRNGIRAFSFRSVVQANGKLVVLSTKPYYGGDETDLESNGFQLFRMRNDGRPANP